jgi:RNA polymerase sigma-70 factor, ECF subfamily
MLAESPDTIETLIQRCLSGDQSAWERIVQLHRRKVFNVAYKFVGRHEEAEDLTQDIFLKVFKSLNTFDRRANFQTWLISVSRNLCIDHYRSVRKERESIDRGVDTDTLAPVSPGAGPIEALEQRDRVQLLRQALSALAPTLRMAVVMRDLQEYTYQEIADKLHLPEGTVKSRINRGRTELARQIALLRRNDEQAEGSADDRPRTGAY